MSEKEEWYVRSSDGQVYGPTDRATLVVWAGEGRIEPTGSVSCDRRTWTLAPRMPELEMNWVVETEPGRYYGPFNRKVVSRLSEAGSIPSGSVIYSRQDPAHDKAPAPVERVVEKIVEKRVEVPVEKIVEKVVEKRVEVPVEVEKVVEKIIEKRVEVPVEKIVEKVVEKRVEVPVVVEKIVEKRVEVPVEKIVERIVVREKRVEVPVERIIEVEVPRPVPVQPQVVQAPAPATRGIFKDVDPARLAALEAAARRELAAAKDGRFGMNGLFSRRKP